MMWINYEIYAYLSIFGLLAGSILIYVPGNLWKIVAQTLVVCALTFIVLFIIQLWIGLDRPPLRTLGETRLWYSLFLSVIGFVMYRRWGYRLLFVYALLMSILFLAINIAKPEVQSKALMPALQSAWFVPHVIVYMIAYAFLGFSSIMASLGLYELYNKKDAQKTLQLAENIVYVGYGFLTLGLLFGALWAKDAWGHYWTWDPKETWALLTWGVYLVFMHLRIYKPNKTYFYLMFLAIAFVVLLVSWFGVNYLPSAQSSVHVYAN